MRFRPLPARGLPFLLTFSGLLLSALPAFARDSVDDVAEEIFNYLADIRPAHLFFAGCGFLVIGVFAKYRGSSGLMIFGSFFLAAVCVGAFLIFTLTGDLMGSRMRRHRHTAPAAAAEAAGPATKTASAPPNPNAKVGDACKKATDCNEGTVCAKVAGNRSCWEPCSAQGQCQAGFACMMATSKENVCVR
jgi:hypothetical protein